MSDYKSAMFAGGCFWCVSKPYYEYDGVIRVYSGYAGGSEANPTYEEVKSGKTSHRETVMIIYDPNVISYIKLLDIYLDTINPYDGDGQFIDRGFNYTCAIFTDDENEKTLAEFRIKELEQISGLTTFVPVLPKPIFYMAEEYHQDYAIKNPEKMEIELITSGRKKAQ